MGDAGGDGTALQAVPLDVSETNMSGIVMPFSNGGFEDIILCINTIGKTEIAGDNLSGDHAYQCQRMSSMQLFDADRRKMESIAHTLLQLGGDTGHMQLSVSGNKAAILEDCADVEGLQIVQNSQISCVAGSDGAFVFQAEKLWRSRRSG